jgi:5-methyltetrahydropteroyltriglutamate--homocysteine methyltransferase
MRTSSDRIITSHVGSLPRAQELVRLLVGVENGEPVDLADLELRVRASVNDIVKKQSEVGVDVVNDGEHSKSNFATYVPRRLAGLEPADTTFEWTGTSRDKLEFGPVYEENRAIYAARPSRLEAPRGHRSYVCTGPIRYVGHDEVRRDIENFKAAIAGTNAIEGFMTALSPNMLVPRVPNQFYENDEAYAYALADALREEYLAITEAGIIVQVDDPHIITVYDRDPSLTVSECRRQMQKYIEIINYALRGIPEELVRFHTCYSTNVAPRAHDLELKDYADLMFTINAQGYTFEAANPRHDHEWTVFGDVKMPDHKVLLPGMVSHCVTLVEHPELVAQRIERYASVVGRERVIASNDCGFATAGAHDEVHPLVAWAKMRSLIEGSRIASERLWRRSA